MHRLFKISFCLFFIIIFIAQSIAQDMQPDAAKLYNEGNDNLRSGNYYSAIDLFNKALSLEQDYRISYQLGIAYKKAGQLNNAKIAFENSLKLNPNFEAGYNALGGIYFSLGNYQEAANNFEKVIETTDNNAIKQMVKKNLSFTYAKMGNDAMLDGNTNKAVEYLQKAVENSNYDAAYLSLAKAYSDLGDYDKALESAQNALLYKSSIGEGGPYYYMGIAYKNKGNKVKAAEMFEQAEKDDTYRKLAEYELTTINNVSQTSKITNRSNFSNNYEETTKKPESPTTYIKPNLDDVDIKIPNSETKNPNAIALILAISDYQNSDIPKVKYAKHDAEIIREYLVKSMGYNPDNILPKNPNELLTFGNIQTYIKSILPAYLKPNGSSDLFIYYSGHGAPNATNHEAYIVPWDCNPNFVSDNNAYSMKKFYMDIEKLNARHKIIIVDACFSGQAGNGTSLITNASSAILKINNPLVSDPNTIIFQSSKQDQISNWYDDKRHGMFTYFFLKGLQGVADINKDGNITAEELLKYIDDPNDGLPYFSNRIYQRPQDAQITGNRNLVIERIDK